MVVAVAFVPIMFPVVERFLENVGDANGAFNASLASDSCIVL